MPGVNVIRSDQVAEATGTALNKGGKTQSGDRLT